MRVSTGQGKRCGRETTAKDTRRVVVKSDVVARERGCRTGGILSWDGFEDGFGRCELTEV